jgi:FtsZ-interacting cell division protein ZipA
MSTGTIIAIVVVALILIALFAFVLPRARRKAQVRSREKELHQRRENVADEHRQVADTREREAEMAERKARLAQAEAEKHRADAQTQQQRAEMHERGMADDELIADHEREHFAPALDKERDDATEPAGSTEVRGGPRSGPDEGRTDYEQGHIDEREGRFQREPEQPPAETRRPS